MQAEIVENLIDSYLNGIASIDEIHQLDKWYNSLDAQTDLYIADSFEQTQAVAKGFLELKSKLGIG